MRQSIQIERREWSRIQIEPEISRRPRLVRRFVVSPSFCSSHHRPVEVLIVFCTEYFFLLQIVLFTPVFERPCLALGMVVVLVFVPGHIELAETGGVSVLSERYTYPPVFLLVFFASGPLSIAGWDRFQSGFWCRVISDSMRSKRLQNFLVYWNILSLNAIKASKSNIFVAAHCRVPWF